MDANDPEVSTVIVGCNKLIGCEPQPARAIEAEVRGGFARIKNKAEMIGMTVVFPNNEEAWIGPGDIVYIRGDAVNHTWFKDEVVIDDTPVVLVPFSFVQLAKVTVIDDEDEGPEGSCDDPECGCHEKVIDDGGN